jgi:hypothetical protein
MSKRTEFLYDRLIEHNMNQLMKLLLENGREGLKSGIIQSMTSAIQFYEKNKEEIGEK